MWSDILLLCQEEMSNIIMVYKQNTAHDKLRLLCIEQ